MNVLKLNFLRAPAEIIKYCNLRTGLQMRQNNRCTFTFINGLMARGVDDICKAPFESLC